MAHRPALVIFVVPFRPCLCFTADQAVYAAIPYLPARRRRAVDSVPDSSREVRMALLESAITRVVVNSATPGSTMCV